MNPDQTINLNQNAADCIKSATRFGETVYTNICNGNISHVAWGGIDWVLCLFLIGLGAIILLLFLSIGIAIVRD